MAWVNADPVRQEWYERGKTLHKQWSEAVRPHREKIYKETGKWPLYWDDPLSAWVSPWSQAAEDMGIDEPVWHCTPSGYRHYRRSRGAKPPATPPDPLVLDLNGDGIRTISVDDGMFFDYNGDGFSEQTGWFNQEDGLLVMDRNGDGFINDGKELFGNQTILKDGTQAANGFEALAELDLNNDGRIDAADAAYSELRILKYHDSGYDIYALDDLGIKSINLDSTITNFTDEQGNTQFRAGSFEKSDGTSGLIADYGFPITEPSTVPLEWLYVPEEIRALPDLQGSGVVYDLHQAMVRDTAGELTSLVEQFISAVDPALRSALVEQIFFKWAGGESIDPHSRGSNIDARKLAVLEHWFGEVWHGESGLNPNYAASLDLNEAYREIFETLYSDLLSQTHLKQLYDKLSYTWDEGKQEVRTDFSAVIPDILAELNNDPLQGEQLLGEFARMLRGIGSCPPNCYFTFRVTMIEIDSDLAWVFDTGALPVYEHLHQGTRSWSPHIEGTDNADAVKGSLTEGDGYLNGLNGNDVIYGTNRNDILINVTGDALLAAGAGNDQIWAGAGNDILDGGTGNDVLKGEAGDDTYIFRRGSGQDIIVDADPTPGNVDTIWLGSFLTPEEVVLRRSGNNLVLKILDTTDTLTVQDYFRNDSPLNRIEQIQFMDGTVWTHEDILVEIVKPSEGDDIIYGCTGDDLINGAGGNDALYRLAEATYLRM